ncbi:MAG: HAMP domain-containing histidine kinase [Candidatus Moranbacteria bacterium]|nr:HAMP domain-containing histidine kinase [Candidatus Moranbacteria bacterium]
MGVLAYLIVKYKAFDIKLIGAQALVYSLVILIGSQFFFIQNNTNRILAGMTLIIASGFGYFLIKTVKLDLQRKDELQRMADALAVSNDRLKKADNAKTEFISIASHQLRTPLTVIKGYVSLLTEGTFGDVSEDVKRVVKNIKISNDRLIELVEDLLNISRMESGRMEFKFAPTDVPELCTELYNSFGARDKENHDIEFKLDLPEEGIRKISTDRSKLREVISNLIDNAVKYTPQGWVRIKAFQKNKMIVRIEISDSGIGIPETEMPYLFAKFSRGKDTGRLTAPGTGLGLHVSRSMVEALHGRVWAESEGDKKGSTFIIELPAGDEETGDDVENVRTEMPRLDTLEKALPATPRRMEVPEPVANEPTSQAEAPQEEKPVPAVTEVSVTEKPRTEPAPEGRIIFSEPKKRNRIV